jgi:hypothetical protein
MPNGYELEVPDMGDEAKTQLVAREYFRVVTLEAEKRQVKAMKAAALVGVIPPAIILVLGLATGWIIRGFRTPRNSP